MFARVQRWAAVMGGVLLAGSTVACGPVQSTSYLVDTETMLEAARTAQADRNAPYEYTAASLYYQKSKEEVGYSDYEQAIDYAKKALDFATRARDTSVKAAKRAAETTPPAPVVP